jgi:hypothetical protein
MFRIEQINGAALAFVKQSDDRKGLAEATGLNAYGHLMQLFRAIHIALDADASNHEHSQQLHERSCNRGLHRRSQ